MAILMLKVIVETRMRNDGNRLVIAFLNKWDVTVIQQYDRVNITHGAIVENVGKEVRLGAVRVVKLYVVDGLYDVSLAVHHSEQEAFPHQYKWAIKDIGLKIAD
jgi:hypothetical protein